MHQSGKAKGYRRTFRLIVDVRLDSSMHQICINCLQNEFYFNVIENQEKL